MGSCVRPILCALTSASTLVCVCCLRSFIPPRAPFARLFVFPRNRQLDLDLDERVEHLVLVVHGIGDALMSVDLGVVQLRSLVECCDTMRAHHEEVSTGRGSHLGLFWTGRLLRGYRVCCNRGEVCAEVSEGGVQMQAFPPCGCKSRV